jgi:hypothetical protein
MRDFLADDGILAQWVQLYELSDGLFLSVLAALDQVFPSYRVYLVGDHDVAIVAAAEGDLGEPDWSVLQSESFLRFTAGVPPFRPEHMQSLLLFDRETMAPLLAQGVAANSDYRPILDLGAERTRFEGTSASGVFSFAISRLDLLRALREERMAPAAYHTVPARGLEPAMLAGRAAWLRSAMGAGGGIAPEDFPQWQSSLVALRLLLDLTREDQRAEWQTWLDAFARSEGDIHWGTSGWVDTTFYRQVYDFLDRASAPEPARAAVDLLHGLSLFEWERVAATADVLVPRVASGESWVDPATLLDAAVIAYLRTGRPEAARNALELLRGRSGRAADNLRQRLLEALVSQAGR